MMKYVKILPAAVLCIMHDYAFACNLLYIICCFCLRVSEYFLLYLMFIIGFLYVLLRWSANNIMIYIAYDFTELSIVILVYAERFENLYFLHFVINSNK